MDANLTRTDGWRASGGGAGPAGTTPEGLVLPARAQLVDNPNWRVADSPATVPALVTTAALAERGNRISGLGHAQLHIDPVAVSPALPRAGTRVMVVDREFARRASDGASTYAFETVWLAPSAVSTFPGLLDRAGVTVLAADSAADLTRVYQRQGPALAVLFFLAAAVLAAVLAAGAAVLTLHLAGRRRTYEFASLYALGVRRSAVVRSLILEQGLLIVFGVLIGVAAGLGATALALPSVPEFGDDPTAPPLRYGVPPGPLLLGLAAALVVLFAVVALSARTLARRAGFEQLREAPA